MFAFHLSVGTTKKLETCDKLLVRLYTNIVLTTQPSEEVIRRTALQKMKSKTWWSLEFWRGGLVVVPQNVGTQRVRERVENSEALKK